MSAFSIRARGCSIDSTASPVDRTLGIGDTGNAMKAFFPYAATTLGITVRVSVNFLPEQSRPDEGRWFWAYHIRIENERDETVQLIARSWSIIDGRGAVQLVEGEGVIGEQPVLLPGGAFDYVSGTSLGTAGGHMNGHYSMVDEGGDDFEIAIPRFPLIASMAKS